MSRVEPVMFCIPKESLKFISYLAPSSNSYRVSFYNLVNSCLVSVDEVVLSKWPSFTVDNSCCNIASKAAISHSVYVIVYHNTMMYVHGVGKVNVPSLYFHWQCVKTIGLCFKLCIIKLWCSYDVWRGLGKKLELQSAAPQATLGSLSCSELDGH